MKIKTNIYWASIYQLSLPLIILWLSRIAFYLSNKEIIGEIPTQNLIALMGHGISFDILPLIYFNLVWIILRFLPFDFTSNKIYLKISDILFFFTNTILLILNFGDIIYIRFNGARLRYTTLNELFNDDAIGNIFLSYMIEYWHAFFWGIITLIILFWLYNRVEITPSKIIFKKLKKLSRYTYRTLILLIAIGAIAIGIRGNITQGRPLRINDATLYVKNINEVNVLLNTPFCILRSISSDKDNIITPFHFFSEAELRQKRNSIHDQASSSPFNILQKNVMIICLEGIGQLLIDNLSPLDGEHKLHLTPFLDSLSKESLVCTNMHAIGRKTHGGNIAISGGFPEFEPFVYMKSAYMGNSFDSNANLLKNEGYQTLFYMGGSRGSYNIDEFARIAGFTQIRTRIDYNNDDDYDGTWGIYDHKMAEYINQDLSTIKTPFYAMWLTISSHSPFKTPSNWELEKYKNKETGILRSIEYADLSIRHFFREASKQPWYKNTIFIITADHGCRDFEVGSIYANPYFMYQIPFIVYTPDKSITPQRIEDKVMSQIDINPTILSLLNYNKKHFSLGESMFDENRKNYAINFRLNQYQVIGTKYLVRLASDGKEIDCVYDIINDKELKHPLKGIENETIKDMVDYAQAFLQDYTHRIVKNQMRAKVN